MLSIVWNEQRTFAYTTIQCDAVLVGTDIYQVCKVAIVRSKLGRQWCGGGKWNVKTENNKNKAGTQAQTQT